MDGKEGLNWDVVVIPVPKAGDTSLAPLGGEAWTVPQNADAEKRDAAARFIDCINSDEHLLQLAVKRQTVPTKTALQAQFLEEAPDMAVFSELVQDARSRTAILGEDWAQTGAEIYTAFQQVLVGGATPQEAVDAIAQ